VGLPDLGTDLELEPGATRKFHFGPEAKHATRHMGFHSPEIHGVTHPQFPRVPSTSAHAHASKQPIKGPAELP
jgi:hypothetical protein